MHGVEPTLVCAVRFREWTSDGKMRQPIFLGLRDDRSPRAVRRERPKPVSQVLEETPPPRPRGARSKSGRAAASAARPRAPADGQTAARAAARPTRTRTREQHVEVAGRSVRLTNLDKVYWPESGYTKGDLIAYYRDIAPVMVPYLRDRPQSLHRHPEGIAGPNFFQKDVAHGVPEWMERAKMPAQSGRRTIHYVLCQDEASLVVLANLGCIELNPWNSRVQSPDRPDYAVIDLDPERVPFDGVVAAALAVRRVLERAGAEAFPKTSGKTGMHLYVPLGARYDYEQARLFAEIIANLVQRNLPESTSVLRNPSKRQQKVYLDFLQNNRGQTLAAPYSVRPVPGATVSTPLRWSEVRRGLDPTRFTIKTMVKRLDKIGDLWAAVLGEAIDLLKVIDRLRQSGMA